MFETYCWRKTICTSWGWQLNSRYLQGFKKLQLVFWPEFWTIVPVTSFYEIPSYKNITTHLTGKLQYLKVEARGCLTSKLKSWLFHDGILMKFPWFMLKIPPQKNLSSISSPHKKYHQNIQTHRFKGRPTKNLRKAWGKLPKDSSLQGHWGPRPTTQGQNIQSCVARGRNPSEADRGMNRPMGMNQNPRSEFWWFWLKPTQTHVETRWVFPKITGENPQNGWWK